MRKRVIAVLLLLIFASIKPASASYEYSLITTIDLDGPVLDLDTTQYADYIAIGTGGEDKSIYLLHRDQGVLWRFKTDGPVRAVGIHPLGKFITASAIWAGFKYLYWFSKDGSKFREVELERVGWSIDVSKQGYVLLGFGEIPFVVEFDPYGNVVFKQRVSDSVRTLAFSKDENRIAVGSGSSAYLLDKNGNFLWRYYLITLNGTVMSVDFLNNTHFIAVTKTHDYLYLIDGAHEKILKRLELSDKPVDAKVLPNGNVVVAYSHEIVIYNWNGDVLFKRKFSDTVTSLAVSKGGSYIIVGTNYATENGFKGKVYILEGGEAKISTISIDSKPQGAKVYINGEYRGQTPLTVSLKPGKYEIKISADGYKPYVQTLNLFGGENKQIIAELEPVVGYLTIETSPPNAKVYINGKYVGTTPLSKYKLTPGQYEIRIVKIGYKEYRRTVKIENNEEKVIKVELTKVQISPSSTTTSSPTETSISSTSPVFSSTTTTHEEKKGICGPAFVLVLTFITLTIKHKEKV